MKSTKFRVGLIVESLNENDAIGNNFRKRREVLDKIGVETLPIMGYTPIEGYKKYQITQKRFVDILRISSFIKFISNPIKYTKKGKNLVLSSIKKNDSLECQAYLIDFSSHSGLMKKFLKEKNSIKIVDFHGITPPEYVENKIMQNELMKAQGQIPLIKNADIVLVHSKFILNQVKKIHPLNNYIAPLSLFSEKNTNKPRRIRNKERLRLIYVGRISEHKGIHILINALSKLDFDYCCNIIGDYSSYYSRRYLKRLKQTIKNLKLTKKIKFLGRISDKELEKRYEKADLFLTASFHEGFCIPIVEAMSLGIPVIGSDSSAIPSTIGKGGIVFRTGDPEDLKNKIIKLCSDKNMYHKLSKNAISESKKYTDKAYTNFYKDLLKRII